MREVIKLEKKITGKILAIKEGKETPQSSGIGILFKMLGERDEASYEKMIQKYQTALAEIKDNK
jgi:hypothetical protein